MNMDKSVLALLAAPFPERAVSWKPQATNANKTKALAVAYIDARAVMNRLDDVVQGDWSFRWEAIAGVGGAVKGMLTVCGVTREDVGEEGDSDQGQTCKAAVSDALKRAAVQFGIGRYLYDLDPTWVEYDERTKKLLKFPVLPDWAKPHGDESDQRRASVQPQPTTGGNSAAKSQRPADPETVKGWLAQKVAKGSNAVAAQGLRGATVGALELLFANDNDDGKASKRHMLTQYFFGKPKSEALTDGECRALTAWAQEPVGNGQYITNSFAVQEAAKIIETLDTAQGQQPLM